MTGRSLIRVLRWVALAAVAPVLWACNARTLEKPMIMPEQTYGKNFAQTINRDIDLLFLIDDSTSMKPVQANLTRNFPTFMTALRAIPGGLPNVHISVISSDMGAGAGDIGQCNASGGDNGIFQTAPKGATCMGGASGINTGDAFISDVMGTKNYTGNLEDVFSCIATLGDTGCGMEQQFGSIVRALGADGAGPPIENANFLRDTAYLGIIIISNEDDCTSGVGPNFYDTSANNSLDSQLGPLQSYRCNEWGHLCDGGKPVRVGPNNATTDVVTYQSCTSAEGSGYLKTVAETVAQVKAVKHNDDSMILVASIQGPPTPYVVNWKAAPVTDTGPWPFVAPACMSTTGDGSYADPGVRMAEFVSGFGANGLQLSICAGQYSTALMRIAELIGQTIQPPCITQKVALKPGTQDPDCTVVSHTKDTLGNTMDKAVPHCGNGVTAPCWQLIAGGGNGSTCNGQIVDPAMLMDPNASTSTASQNATVNCSLCDPMFPDPNRGC